MPIVKLTLSEEHYNLLKEMAERENQSMQDYIRSQIFDENTIFTPEEAVNRIKHGNFSDEKFPDGFTLPDVYAKEWTIERGPAGVFGKKFYNYVVNNPDTGIRFMGMGKYGRRAVYKLAEKS